MSSKLVAIQSRGNFLKCNIPHLIDDPFWALSEKIELPANITRKEDKEILLQLLDLVEKSETHKELSVQTLICPDGNSASCDSVGVRIAEILKEEEDAYVRQVLNYAKKITLDPSRNGLHELTAENLFSVQISCAKGLAEGENSILLAKSFCATCLYTGYVLSRLYFYANARARDAEELNVDGNDCEDAYICLNLDIGSDDILVTNDQGTISAIQNTIRLLNAILPSKIREDRVINSAEFLVRVAS